MTTEITTETAPVNSDFWVRSFLITDLRAKFDKLARRAVKLGCVAPTLKIVGTETREIGRTPPVDGERLGQPIYAEFSHIVVDGVAPKFAGWRLVARLLHDSQTGVGSSTIVNAVPGETVPPQYRSSGCKCDHCNKNWLVRKDTYVVAHDDGTTKQVGSSCLADFLGHVDPQQLALIASFYTDAFGALAIGEDDDFSEDPHGLYVRGASLISLKTLLSVSAAHHRLYGWTTSAQARLDDRAIPSVGRVLSAIFGNSKESKELRAELAPTEADTTLATNAIEWAKTADTSSDFMHNLSAIAKAETASYRTTGMACAIIGAYKRHIEGEFERKSRPESNHVGTVGERLTMDLHVIVTRAMPEGIYGPTTLHRFADESGNIFTWFASGEAKFNDGDNVTVKATIKKHDVYKGLKQTVLSRVMEIASTEQQAKLAALSPAAETMLAHCQGGNLLSAEQSETPVEEYNAAVAELESLGYISTVDCWPTWTLDDAAKRLQSFAKPRKSKGAKKSEAAAKKALRGKLMALSPKAKQALVYKERFNNGIDVTESLATELESVGAQLTRYDHGYILSTSYGVNLDLHCEMISLMVKSGEMMDPKILQGYLNKAAPWTLTRMAADYNATTARPVPVSDETKAIQFCVEQLRGLELVETIDGVECYKAIVPALLNYASQCCEVKDWKVEKWKAE